MPNVLVGLKKHQSRSNRSVVELAALAPPDTGAVGDGTTRAGSPIPDFLAAGAHAASAWGPGCSRGSSEWYVPSSNYFMISIASLLIIVVT